MTDAERMLALLKAYPQGVHSHELRSRGISGNPSQRAADLEAKGHEIERKREHRNGRPGCRYKLVGVGAGNGGRDTALVVDRPAKPQPRPSVDSGEPLSLLPPEPKAPSAYDPWEDAA